jgi:hypothetical protein
MRVYISGLSLGPANLDKQVSLVTRNVVVESEIGRWPAVGRFILWTEHFDSQRKAPRVPRVRGIVTGTAGLKWDICFSIRVAVQSLPVCRQLRLPV